MRISRPRTPLAEVYANYDPLQPYVVEDLTNDVEEWKNVDSVVKLSIKALTKSAKSQALAIRELERNLSMRVHIAEFQEEIAKKLNSPEISAKIAEIRALLDKKASSNDIEILNSAVKNLTYELNLKGTQGPSQKPNDTHSRENSFKDLLQDIYKKIDSLQGQIDNFISKDISRFDENRYSVTKTGEIMLRLQDCDQTSRDLRDKIRICVENIERVGKTVKLMADCLTTKAESKDIQSLQKVTEKKADIEYVESQLAEQKKQISEISSSVVKDSNSIMWKNNKILLEKIEKLETNVISLGNDLKESFAKKNSYEQKVRSPTRSFNQQDFADWKAKIDKQVQILEKNMKSKPDKSEIKSILHEINEKLHSRIQNLASGETFKRPSYLAKANSDENSKTQTRSSIFSKNYNFELSFSNKILAEKDICSDVLEKSQEIAIVPDALDEKVLYLQNKIQELAKDILLKASVKDVCTLLDMKANIEDVNVALTEIHRELDTKINKGSL